MKMNGKKISGYSICRGRNKIDSQPDYQRPPVWKKSQKQLLIDSILRGYDIPKMYWQSIKEKRGNIEHEVVDGQQRLRAIWGFRGGEFGMPSNADKIDNINVAGKKFEELPETLQDKFDVYNFDVVVIEDAIQNEVEDEVRDMFLRLQAGTTLKAQEKRNAMTGKLRDYIKDLAKNKFWQCSTC